MINLIVLLLILCVPAMVLADQESEIEVKKLNKKIAELKAEYHREQLSEMRQEVNAQDYMIADWENFSDETQDIKKSDLHTDKILKEIEALELRKNTLIKQYTDKNEK